MNNWPGQSNHYKAAVRSLLKNEGVKNPSDSLINSIVEEMIHAWEDGNRTGYNEADASY